MRLPVVLPLALCLTVAACGREATRTMDELTPIAEGYVKLVLALGERDEGYVDAYYGPPEWRDAARQEKKPLALIQAQAESLLAQLAQRPAPADELPALRLRYLRRQLEALRARTQQLQGRRFAFDEEAHALYDVRPPRYPEKAFAPALAELDRLLPPGSGALSARYNAYLERFGIPADRLEAVMRDAIAAARTRTQRHIALPPGESFTLALVRDKPWSAYNWYLGGYASRIEINTDLPVTAARAIELAVHEGYPGHHVYNALLERELVRGRGWPEFQVYALYSPQSLIAEGTADYGIELAYPPPARLALLREKIFPAAGLDPAQAETYLAVARAARRLSGATIEAARRYRDGRLSREQAVAFLQTYALASPQRARQRLAFFDALGAYIVNYSLGEERVRAYVERRAGTGAGEDARWAVYRELLASPRLPSDLLDGGA